MKIKNLEISLITLAVLILISTGAIFAYSKLKLEKQSTKKESVEKVSKVEEKPKTFEGTNIKLEESKISVGKIAAINATAITLDDGKTYTTSKTTKIQKADRSFIALKDLLIGQKVQILAGSKGEAVNISISE